MDIGWKIISGIFIFTVLLISPGFGVDSDTAPLKVPDKELSQSMVNHQIFRPGEKIRLRVTYLGFTAGYLKMGFEKEQIDNHPVYQLKVTGNSRGLARWFYTIRDQFISYVDSTGFFSLGYDYYQNHGGETDFESLRYDHDEGLFFKNGSTEPRGKFPPFSQDVVSAIYFLRAQNLEVGQYYHFPVHLDDEAYNLQIYVEGKETVATRDRGWVEAFRIHPSLQDEKMKQELREKLKDGGNGVRIWISDDQYKIPLRIAVPAKIGSFWGYLDQYDPGESRE